VEETETFSVSLLGSTSGAGLGTPSTGTGTITKDDFPTPSIANVSQAEGNPAQGAPETTTFTFTVSLSSPALAGGVGFDIATANGTGTNAAMAGSDYASKSLTAQTIAAGQSSYEFTVVVNGDTSIEEDELFAVNLSNITGASNTSASATGTIQNDDFNANPTALSLSSTNVAENSDIGTTVGTFSTSDENPGDTFTYSFVDGQNDNASFSIVGNTLKTNTALDFETKSSYTVRVRTTDTANATLEETFTITVTNVNEAPTAIALSNQTLAENAGPNFVIGTLSTTDVDAGDTAAFSLPAGLGDNDLFNINAAELRATSSFNFETESSYSITIRVTDSGGATFNQNFTISVTDVNEAPTALSLSSTNVDENSASGTTVGTFTTTDADTGDTFTYTFVAGEGDTNNDLFDIAGGMLKTRAIFDFETKASYSIRVQTDDGQGGLFEETFIITVNDVNDAPIITSDGGEATATKGVAENTTAVTTVTATDVDSTTLGFSISGAMRRSSRSAKPAF
jgi:hypothetical protein